MKGIIAQLKNANQKIRQRISFFFPGYIKKVYFRDIEEALQAKPLKISRTENELLFIADVLPSNAVCIDIGANRGDYVYALERSKKCTSLYALEPIPELNDQLKNLFPGARVCQEAISDKSGTNHFNIPFIHSRYFDTRGTLEAFEEKGQTSTRTISVETITLDDFIKRYGISQLDLVKMDIEGHEFAALKGAKYVMENLRPLWMIEIEQRHHPEYPIREIFTFVEQFGYRGYFFDAGIVRFRSLEEFSTETFQQLTQMNNKEKYINNFFFIPAEKNTEVQTIFATIANRFRTGNA